MLFRSHPAAWTRGLRAESSLLARTTCATSLPPPSHSPSTSLFDFSPPPNPTPSPLLRTPSATPGSLDLCVAHILDSLAPPPPASVLPRLIKLSRLPSRVVAPPPAAIERIELAVAEPKLKASVVREEWGGRKTPPRVERTMGSGAESLLAELLGQ